MNTSAVIDNVRLRLKRLTNKQRNIRVGDKVPTIAELLPLLTDDVSDLSIGTPLDENKLYHLGQLVVILDILTTRDVRPVLVRWFD